MKKSLKIEGMTCINCQNIIEQAVQKIAGVSEVSVNYNSGLADIAYDEQKVALTTIIATIEKLDYQVVDQNRSAKSTFGKTAATLLTIVVLYGLLQVFGVLNLLVPAQLADSGMSLGMLFLIGLITSVHCIAMCGGINLSQCIGPNQAVSAKKPTSWLTSPAVIYNFGRIIAYTVIGFILGGIGMLLTGGTTNGLSLNLQGGLKIFAGLAMVIMGTNMVGLVPVLRYLQPRLPKSWAQKMSTRSANSRRPLLVGLLNGLMPCGPLQAMQIIALAAGNPIMGAMSMLMFSLGTVPLMLCFGSLVTFLGKKYTHRVMQIGSILVIVLGLAMLSQGCSLAGLISPLTILYIVSGLAFIAIIYSWPFKKSSVRWAATCSTAALIAVLGYLSNNRQQNHFLNTETQLAQASSADHPEIQEIESNLEFGKYPDINVRVGIPVKWVINASSDMLNGCNYKMLVTSLGITKELNPGKNVIEFTPKTTGIIQATCWMGMIYGNIIVGD